MTRKYDTHYSFLQSFQFIRKIFQDRTNQGGIYFNKTFYEALSRWGYENIDLFGLLAIGIRILNYYKNMQMYNAIRSCQAQFFISTVRYNLSIHPVVLKTISTFLKETLVKTKKKRHLYFIIIINIIYSDTSHV